MVFYVFVRYKSPLMKKQRFIDDYQFAHLRGDRVIPTKSSTARPAVAHATLQLNTAKETDHLDASVQK